MKKERNCINKITGIVLAALLVFVAFGVMPVAASELPDYQQLYVDVANTARFDYQSDNTYLIDWTNSTGGLNALHISDDYTDVYGEIVSTSESSGHFYVTDTGGRHYQDNIVLLVAVNSSMPDDLSLTISSSGYQWTPTADGYAPPYDPNTVPHKSSEIDATFDSSDYTEVSGVDVFQVWKPGPTDEYPIYNGQPLGAGDTFKLMFIDLHVGTFYNVSDRSTLTDYGNVRVDYEIEDLPEDSVVAFNAYAWNNQTSHPYPQGIRWTNRVYASGESSSGASGYIVNT